MSRILQADQKNSTFHPAAFGHIWVLAITGNLSLMLLSGFLFGKINFGLIEAIVFGIIVVFFLIYPDKAVYKLEFNDDNQTCTISFYRLFFLKAKRVFNYNDLLFSYEPTMYGRYEYLNVFRIRYKGRLLFQIRQKHNVGWKKDTIHVLDDYTRNNPLLKYDKEVLARNRVSLLPEE